MKVLYAADVIKVYGGKVSRRIFILSIIFMYVSLGGVYAHES